MKKVLLLVSLIVLFGCGGGRSSVALVGTSLSWKGFVPLLQNHPELNLKIINAGYSAWGSEKLMTIYDGIIDRHPDTIMIETAMNDCYFRLPLDDMEVTIKKMVDLGRIFGVRMILMTTNPSTVDRPDLHDYYDRYRAIAARYGVEIIDMEPLWQGTPAAYIPDGIHPTVEALEIVVFPVMATALQLGISP